MRVHKSVTRDTGIHRTSVRIPPQNPSQLAADQGRCEGIRKIAENYERSLVALLQQKEVELQPFLNQKGQQIGLVAWTLDAIPWAADEAAQAQPGRDPITQDASAALTQLKFLLMSLDSGDIMEVALDAYELGRLVERVRTRQFEALVAPARRPRAAIGPRPGKASGSTGAKAARKDKHRSEA